MTAGGSRSRRKHGAPQDPVDAGDPSSPTSRRVNGHAREDAADAPAPPHSVEAEQATLGGLLIDHTAWDQVVDVVRQEDFYRPDHQLIFGAIAAVIGESSAADVVTVSNYLGRIGQLEKAGGLAYLSSIARDTPTAINVRAWAQIVRERACLRQLEALGSEVNRSIADGRTSAAIATQLHSAIDRVFDAGSSQVARLQLRHVADIVAEHREPQWLVPDVLERNVTAVLAGRRGTFKSFVGLHWMMTAAVDGASVLILSAEGAGLDRRIDAWMRTHAPRVDLRSLSITALEGAINLNDPQTLRALRSLLRARGVRPDVAMIDTLSKYAPGLDENDNGAVAAYLSAINHGLQAEFCCTVLLVAHAGHGDARRPRGASALMANPDAEYIVERPDAQALTATVTRERFKDCAALPPLIYRAESVDLGRVDRRNNQVRSLVIRDADAATVVRPALSGKNQKRLLAELEQRAAAHDCLGIWTEGELREIGRSLDMGKQSARDAVHGLRSLGYLMPTVGGCRLGYVPEGQKVRNGAESQKSARDDGAEKAEGSVRPSASARPSCPEDG